MAQKLKTLIKAFVTGLPLAPDDHVLVAVSGGADSMALAALLFEHLGPRLRVLHCNHGLRGKESEADERLVQQFCVERGIGLYRFKKKLAKGKGLEERARDWRRSCYVDAAHEARAPYVFLAHHAQDQAETLLMNLMRGAGAQGALGMKALANLEGTHARLARPLLEVMPAELRAELKARHIRWREDASNADTKLKRNALRHEVLPLLEKIWPGATMNLAAFTRRSASAGLPGLDDKAMARVRALLTQGKGKADLKGGLRLEASAGVLRLASTPRLNFKLSLPPPKFLSPANEFWFADVELGKQLRIRAAQSGDRFVPFGLKGSKLVFDVLAEAKVPVWKRPGWPLLVHQGTGRILGILGVRQAEYARVTDPKKPALCVTWGGFDKA